MPSRKQIRCDATYTYQNTSIGLEVHSAEELGDIVEALQNEKNSVVILHNHRHNVAIHIYMRFREGAR